MTKITDQLTNYYKLSVNGTAYATCNTELTLTCTIIMSMELYTYMDCDCHTHYNYNSKGLSGVVKHVIITINTMVAKTITSTS